MGAPAPAARGPKVALCGPENAREGGPPWPGWWATPPAGDLNHDLVQVDESAIAGNVGRDLAFTASRLAARSHPAAGRCGRLCCALSLVMFGISHPNARSTVGRSRPPGQQCSLCARIRHDRAHICREDDGRGTSRSHATLRLQRAADARHRVAKRTAKKDGLPRVSVRVLASMRTGSPNRRCSCTRSVRRSRTSSATSTRRVSNPPGQANHPDTSPPGTDGTHFILGTSPRARPPFPSAHTGHDAPSTPSARWRNRAPAGAPLHRHRVDASPDSLDAHSHHGCPPFAPTPGRVRELQALTMRL